MFVISSVRDSAQYDVVGLAGFMRTKGVLIIYDCGDGGIGGGHPFSD